MTSTFRGKWTIYSPNNKHYVGYTGTDDRLCVRDGPGKETYIVFVLRSDNELCFYLQNSAYVGPGPELFNFVDNRGRAGVFTFVDHDFQNLPASFTSKIHSVIDNSYMFDVTPFVFAEKSLSTARVFTITQHTPTLEQIQASKKGDGLDLAGVDLSGGALDQVSLVGTDFSHSNLSNVTLTNCILTKALLNNCTLVKTDLSGSNLSGAKLDDVDLKEVMIGTSLPKFCTNRDQAPSPTDPRTTFFHSTFKQALLGSEWSKLDLKGATVVLDPASPLSSDTKKLYAKHSILTSLNNNDLKKLKLPSAVFDYAVLDQVNFTNCDLTGASFTQASMHGTVLANATLTGAIMIGAQLGSLSNLFTLPTSYQEHLNAGPNVDDTLRKKFSENGITLSTSATLDTPVTGRVWQLNDRGNNIIYTVRLETTDSSQLLIVYKPGVPANISGAYMPNADLSQANLFGITANDIQFYGPTAKVSSAILEEAKLNNSNLSTVDFTQAQLLGANLSNCHLFNAKFNKANLSRSAAGTIADLGNSNLQGADFTNAQLYGANLANAAVAVKVPTKVNPTQGGVYLFSLPYSGDKATVEQYKNELNTEAPSFFSLTPGTTQSLVQSYVLDLNNNTLSTPLKTTFLKHKIKWSAVAQITIIEKDQVWQIVEMDNTLNPQTYLIWTGLNENGTLELYTGLPLTLIQAGFKRRGITVRWQANAAIDIANQWLLDNDSENPHNFTTGYVKFILKLNGNVLDVYGSALRILRLGAQGQEEFDTEPCLVTTLSENNMSEDTCCPNGLNYGVNKSSSGKSWDDLWMRAEIPPRPPDCVPTPTQWCDQPKAKKKESV